MDDPPQFQAPLHLQGYLSECAAALAAALRGAVSHTVSHAHALSCSCRRSSMQRSLAEAERSDDPRTRKSASSRRQALERHQQERRSSASNPRLLAVSAAGAVEQRAACRLFSIELNDEEGVVRGFCRRCQKMFPVFDRALYWGVKRGSGETPKTYPYRCTCGGHTFELAVGFDYPEDALDENDIHTISLAVRCAACEEISVILDEEAT